MYAEYEIQRMRGEELRREGERQRLLGAVRRARKAAKSLEAAEGSEGRIRGPRRRRSSWGEAA